MCDTALTGIVMLVRAGCKYFKVKLASLRLPFCSSILIDQSNDDRSNGSAQTGLVQLHVQKNASHNVFDFYGDVADPIASFLKRHERAPWRAGGEQREPMGLDLRHLDARVQQAGPGEMEEYPFASAAV